MDPETHKLWVDLYRGQMTHWSVPTGKVNNILVLDVDVKGDGFETLKSLELPGTMLQRTPSGGAHYIFKYPNDGRTYGNRVKFLPGLDIRGEGGNIVWYGCDPNQPILEAPAWLIEKAKQVHDPKTNQTAAPFKVSPEIAQKRIEEALERIREAPAGEANNTLNVEAFALGQLVASQSITREYAFEALFRAAKERGKPEREAKATIDSGLDGGLKKPIQDPFQATPPPPGLMIPPPPAVVKWTPSKTTREELFDFSKLKKPQLFENWSTEDIHLTTADGGTGKTTLMLFEAVCLALGERFLTFRCLKPGKTLFITGEDTAEKLKAMIGQILKQMGLLDSPEYEEQVQTVLESIYIKKDSDLCLIVKDRNNNFLLPNPLALGNVLQAVEDLRPSKIVFDPISSFWGSEAALNDMAKAVTKFMSELVERSGACVEMINHMGKQASAGKDESQFAGRGGTGLPSHARVVRTLRPVFDQEYTEMTGEVLLDKQSAMRCTVAKFSDGSPLYNKPFLILRDGFLFTKKNLTDAKAREAEEKMSDVERVFQFIKESREANKFPTKAVVLAHFKLCGNSISESRVESALEMIAFQGHLGEKIKLVENPDATEKQRVYVITDMDGRE